MSKLLYVNKISRITVIIATSFQNKRHVEKRFRAVDGIHLEPLENRITKNNLIKKSKALITKRDVPA